MPFIRTNTIKRSFINSKEKKIERGFRSISRRHFGVFVHNLNQNFEKKKSTSFRTINKHI